MRPGYKVCILAAGVGSKLGDLSKNIHSAILPVNFKATISYIVEKFHNETEIVIAVGHQKETVKDYLSLAYPERQFTFVEIDNYMGPGYGPGYSLYQCKDHLQCPFVFFTSDTIVLEDIPAPTENWLGLAPVKDTESFCTVKTKNSLISSLDDKIKTDNKFAFIGLAGVRDYEIFWDALEKGKGTSNEEIRDIEGFRALIERKLLPVQFTWFDTGSVESYIETNKNFLGVEETFDFSKNNEFLYFVNGRVIKFYANMEIAKKRVERAKYLEGLCPEIEGSLNNFYSYKKIEGHTLYKVLNPRILSDFLNWADKELWTKPAMSEEEKKKFKDICKDFYYEKTLKRVSLFQTQNNIIDSENIINGVLVPSLSDLLKKVNWESLFEGIPARFHGDFKFGNILVTTNQETHMQKFILLDWRQEFGGLTKYGDIYYDLAKFYAGIILSDELIKKGLFSFDISGASVYFDYSLKKSLFDAKEKYEYFLKEKGFDLTKVRTLTAITFLNMSPLHNYPFNFLVYFLGKSMLNEVLTSLSKEVTK